MTQAMYQVIVLINAMPGKCSGKFLIYLFSDVIKINQTLIEFRFRKRKGYHLWLDEAQCFVTVGTIVQLLQTNIMKLRSLPACVTQWCQRVHDQSWLGPAVTGAAVDDSSALQHGLAAACDQPWLQRRKASVEGRHWAELHDFLQEVRRKGECVMCSVDWATNTLICSRLYYMYST